MLRKTLMAVTTIVLLCAQTVSHASPATGPSQTILTIDPADSSVMILVGKTGVLSLAGHTHEVVAPLVRGRVTLNPADWQQASVVLEFDASALRVTGKGDSPSHVPEIQRTMLSGQVLDVVRFPQITFQSVRVVATLHTALSADLLIEGRLTLRGTTRPMAIRTAVTIDSSGRMVARGSFSLKQSEFGMVPVTAAGGTIKVKDELDIQFVLKASPSHETPLAR